VVVLSGDHVYKMDYQKLIRYHEAKGAAATVACVEVPREAAGGFGVMGVDSEGRVLSFVEKPTDPAAIPGKPDVALVNMGVYVFETSALKATLCSDADAETRHDFGHDILPMMLRQGGLFAYPFVDENKKSVLYWRDIGTLDAYYEASMDLVDVHPVFNLYDPNWPIRTFPRQLPPAKTVFAQEEPGGRRGVALDSLVSGGVIISGGRVERSILSPHVRVNSYSDVRDSVLMDGVDVGRHARVRRAIVDKRVRIPPGFVVGEDAEADRRRFVVTESGVAVITREMKFE
jgi:glucose-1-phosphate adenylyltransferase